MGFSFSSLIMTYNPRLNMAISRKHNYIDKNEIVFSYSSF